MSDNSRRDDETETEVDTVEVRRSTTEYAEEDVDVERTDYDREEIEATSDVEEIRRWADEHDAVAVRRSGAGDHGLALVRERDVNSDTDMEELSWDEFGREMEENHLAFLYIEGETAGDHAFYDLIDRGRDILTEGEDEYTEVRRTKVIETEVVERDIVESEVVESEVAGTEVVDVELLSRECHGCELEGEDTLMADIEEEKRVRMAVYERDVIATQVVDTDVEETSTVTSDTVDTETETDEGSDLVDDETVEREVEETDVIEREEVEADVVDADVEEDVQMERKLIEATIREHYRVRADVFERELLDSETLDQEVVESELVEEADVEYDETDIETGVDEQVVGDEIVAADVDEEHSTSAETTTTGVDAETGTVSVDDIDQGQTVYDARDEKVGLVTDVEDDHIYVDLHAGLGDRIKASLGWGDHDGDDYTLRVNQIETVDRDGVHLRTMESDVTEEDEDERGL
ncbi:hypothetical protein [Halalkalicoccus salilacus]|uniref:hypothetical protein n=1 Tax=Halalkalicoccus salilacus TaxID=3117459 RepID=UPI00300F5BAC